MLSSHLMFFKLLVSWRIQLIIVFHLISHLVSWCCSSGIFRLIFFSRLISYLRMGDFFFISCFWDRSSDLWTHFGLSSHLSDLVKL